MRFTIISANHANPPPQTEYDFSPPGGTIGRGNDNNLVLPDNDRAISRLQAIVHVTPDGKCLFTNRGNVTRVVLNNIVLERGHQIEVQDGDILEIGDYRIQVGSTRAAAPRHASTFQSATPDITAPVQAGAPASTGDSPLDGLFSEPASARQPDIVKAPPKPQPLSASADVSDEIWNDLLQEFTTLPADSGPTGPDISPFEAPAAPDRNPENPLEHLIPHDDIVLPSNIATDKLFSEESLFKKETILSNTTPTSLNSAQTNADPLQNFTPDRQNTLDPLALFTQSDRPGNSDDPLALLAGQAAPLAPMQETIHTSVAPEQTGAHQQTSAPAQPTVCEPVPVTLPHSLQPATGYDNITLPTPQAVVPTTQAASKGRLRIDPVQTAGSTMPCDTPSNGEALDSDMLNALLEGMGLSDIQPQPQFDRESIRQLGQMLGMFSQGTVALLSSRSILKRGVKADMTMVLEDANNPFKLLPSGKTVLMQMFGTRMPGFMSPTKSVRDALIDLQAHQLGMIAGIRAIIAAMLQSFNPEQLEVQAKQHGALSRLSLLNTRKAALWDFFTRHYAQTAGEIEDDFHTLFGEAFLHAYDMELNQYKDSQTGAEKS